MNNIQDNYVFVHKNADNSVSAFKEKEMKTHLATWPANFSTKPTKKHKKIMLNCVKKSIIWI